MTFDEKMDRFMATLQAAIADKSYNRDVWEWHKTGIKYVRVATDTGNQILSRYFVRREDGMIFACEGYKKPNLKRSYGTLDTLDQFDWSGYNAVAKPESDYVMVGTGSGYKTAVHRNYVSVPS